MAKLTKQQTEAIKAIKEWYKQAEGGSIFTLSGYAGVGKTYLINYIIENDILGINQDEIAFCAPTGKAASLLTIKGLPASTIHSLIYVPIVETKIINTENGEVLKKKIIRFEKKKILDRNYKLIIIDEISMVNKKELKNLQSFDIPILAIGDDFQLPPIGEDNGLLKNPDYKITEVVRQALDNPIIKIATEIRNGNYVPNGHYGTVLIEKKKNLDEKIIDHFLLNSDQVLCGTNKSRHELNKRIRELNGIDTEKHILPIKGEKMICLLNNNEEYIFYNNKTVMLSNGMTGYIENIKYDIVEETDLFSIDFRPDFIEKENNVKFNELIVDDGVFTTKEKTFKYETRQPIYKNKLGELTFKKIKKDNSAEGLESYLNKLLREIRLRDASTILYINRFDFGYAITVHKSQGSQYDKVTIFDESYIMKNKIDRRKWLYTAITRAIKKAVIIR